MRTGSCVVLHRRRCSSTLAKDGFWFPWMLKILPLNPSVCLSLPVSLSPSLSGTWGAHRLRRHDPPFSPVPAQHHHHDATQKLLLQEDCGPLPVRCLRRRRGGLCRRFDAVSDNDDLVAFGRPERISRRRLFCSSPRKCITQPIPKLLQRTDS